MSTIHSHLVDLFNQFEDVIGNCMLFTMLNLLLLLFTSENDHFRDGDIWEL